MLSAPGNRRRQTGLPMASIRLRARQRALKTNRWVALMFFVICRITGPERAAKAGMKYVGKLDS